MTARPAYNEIKAWMVLHNIKQKDFAKTLGTSTAFINLENFQRYMVFPLNIFLLSEFLNRNKANRKEMMP